MTTGPHDPHRFHDGGHDPHPKPTSPYGTPGPWEAAQPPGLVPYGSVPPPVAAPYGAPTGYYGAPPQAQQPSGMYVAAAVVNWVVLALVVVATCGIGLVAAAWFVPMTIYIHRGAKDRVKHTALAVCTLLFCNIVSGILMLVEDGNRSPGPLH